MKRSTVIAQIALLGVVGCGGQIDPVAQSVGQPESISVDGSESESEATTLVSLKVPNMH